MTVLYKEIDPSNGNEKLVYLERVIDICNEAIRLVTPKELHQLTLDKYRDDIRPNTKLDPKKLCNLNDYNSFICTAEMLITSLLRLPNIEFYKIRKKDNGTEKNPDHHYGMKFASDLFLMRGRNFHDEEVLCSAHVMWNLKRLTDKSEIIDSQVINTPQVQWFREIVNYICQKEQTLVFPEKSEKEYIDYMNNLWTPPQTDLPDEASWDDCEYADIDFRPKEKPSSNLRRAFLKLFQKTGSPKKS